MPTFLQYAARLMSCELRKLKKTYKVSTCLVRLFEERKNNSRYLMANKWMYLPTTNKNIICVILCMFTLFENYYFLTMLFKCLMYNILLCIILCMEIYGLNNLVVKGDLLVNKEK